MKSRITHFCLISNFLDIGFNSSEISNRLKMYVDKILEINSFYYPSDWVLTFNANYNNGKYLLITKNKFGSYKSDKVKEISIVIPIPSNSIVEWGVSKESYIYNEDHYDKIINNFFSLDIDYKKFNNRIDYIVDCLQRGICKAFQEGFTVGGIKLKTNNFH